MVAHWNVVNFTQVVLYLLLITYRRPGVVWGALIRN